jgi:hypothetical protein
MSASDGLSKRQFYTESNLLEQGNTDELDVRTRGLQNMTSNVFKPSFSSDYTTVRSTPSPGGDSQASQGNEADVDDEGE